MLSRLLDWRIKEYLAQDLRRIKRDLWKLSNFLALLRPFTRLSVTFHLISWSTLRNLKLGYQSRRKHWQRYSRNWGRLAKRRINSTIGGSSSQSRTSWETSVRIWQCCIVWVSSKIIVQGQKAAITAATAILQSIAQRSSLANLHLKMAVSKKCSTMTNTQLKPVKCLSLMLQSTLKSWLTLSIQR